MDRRHRHLGDGRLHQVVIAGPYSGAHLNPSVTLAFAATGQFPWSDVPGYVLAQMLGGAAGALATWLFYRPHFDLEENPDTIRGVFCTAPAVRNPASNLLSEIIATFVLIFTVFYITEGHLASTEGNVPIGLGSVGALPVALVILVIGGALGGTTGYSLNPARDLFAAHRPRAGPDPPQGRQRLALCVDRLGRTAARGAARRRSSSDDPLLKHESRNRDSGFRVRTGRYSAGIVFCFRRRKTTSRMSKFKPHIALLVVQHPLGDGLSLLQHRTARVRPPDGHGIGLADRNGAAVAHSARLGRNPKRWRAPTSAD